MSSLKPFRPLRPLAILAISGLAVMVVADSLSLIAGLGQVISPDSVIDLDDEGAASIWLMMQGLIFLLTFVALILSGILFLIWLYRAHSNLESLQGRNLEFTPGWAVGYWFVPFVNLYKPFQVVREVWWESNPEIDEEHSFLSESLRTAPTYMGIWWAMWIISNIADNVASRVYDPDTMDNIEISGIVFIVSSVISIAAALLAMKVVWDITKRQTERFANLSSRGFVGDMPPPPPNFGSYP
ncbi:MAG: hypothetical protein DMF63_09045 [Acidobacteria bacterium]|nr:MAG: hypothetical protein DMF63_09045 [Acidobacteriota bacterium]